MLNAIAMKPPCELHDFCVLTTTTKSRAKIWYQFVVDSLLIVAPIVCGVLCLELVLLLGTLCPSTFAIILTRKRKLVALLQLSS